MKLYYIVSLQRPSLDTTGRSFNGLLSGDRILVWRNRENIEKHLREKLDQEKFEFIHSSEELLHEMLENFQGIGLEWQDRSCGPSVWAFRRRANRRRLWSLLVVGDTIGKLNNVEPIVLEKYNQSMDTLEKLKKNGISISHKDIGELCRKYQITEMAVFGSSLRDDFGEASDIDFLVTFKTDAAITLFDIVDLEEELKNTFHREIDVVEKAALKNPYRRKNILQTSEIVYAVG